MKTLYRVLYISLFFTGLIAMFSVSAAENRWYSQADVDRGSILFKQNCSSCHGANAEGTLDWKKTDSNGKYPPPPLNGTAHAWHHSKKLLKKTILEGGAKLGGLMPPFGDKLSDQDIDAVIAFMQSKWTDDVYQKWASRNSANEIPLIGSTTENTNKTPVSSTKKMTELLRLRLGSSNFTDPVETPIAGIYQTQFGKQYGYLSEDGRYVLIGNLVDLKTGENLTKIGLRKTAVAKLNRLALEDKAIFPASGVEKAVLNVFTDTSCPYCRKLHEEISYLQEAGISVHYIPFPRGGSQGPGYQTLKQVWCAKDRATALTIGKGLASGELPTGDCEDSVLVDEGYTLGNQLGITGTPTSFTSNGEAITGYVPYLELIPKVLNN
jgi:protein-disulfide isomerase/mono/diheme cytochrome c family protein